MRHRLDNTINKVSEFIGGELARDLTPRQHLGLNLLIHFLIIANAECSIGQSVVLGSM